MISISIKYHFIRLVITMALSIILMGTAVGQLQFTRYDSISISEGDTPLSNGWAGGLNSPQFSEIDLNGDGFKDLFLFERDWYGMVKTFINQGIENQTIYKHSPYHQQKFPEMRNWSLLVDYNCDGKEDIFTSVPAGIAVFKNNSQENTGLKFKKISSLLLSNTADGLSPLYVSPPDLPAITDVDGDGDMDILAFGVLGKTVKYHKNLSMEQFGHCDSLIFEQANSCWGYFSESDQDNTISLFDTCSEAEINAREGRHAGSAILALDISGNGLKDLLLGDISYNNIVKLTNEGSIEEASMVDADTAFPSDNIPVNLSVFPASFYLDVNNDKKKDLLISPNNPNASKNVNNIWHFENTGSENKPVFELQQTNFLVDQMVDVGEGSRPIFFDANADGLLDIVIGSYGYFVNASDYDSKLALFINTGTAIQPAFNGVNTDYAGLSTYDFSGVYPAFGDMDADGDNDMIIGDEEGQLHLFTNTAGAASPAVFALSHPVYMSIDIGEHAIPQIVDVNRDGKPDLLVGERSGTINYFENEGSQDEAQFNALPTNDLFGGIDVMKECCTGFSAPWLTEDSLGNHLLYTGSERGYLYQYNDIEANLTGNFKLTDSLFLAGLNVTPAAADINNDGEIELIYGEYAGGMAILKKGLPQWINIDESKKQTQALILFPNPASQLLSIRLKTNANIGQAELKVLNMQGQTVLRKNVHNQGSTIVVDINMLPKGIYLLSLSTKAYHYREKLFVN